MKKDRTNPPERKAIHGLDWKDPEDRFLKNGIPVTVVEGGSQDLCRLEFLFKAGTATASHPLLAPFANDLIDEGTSKRSAEEIAEMLDHFGAFVETECHFDHASVFVFTLNKHLPGIMPLLSEFITGAAYPDRDVAVYTANQIEKFKVASGKVNYMCRKKFNEVLFGPSHVYGKNVEIEDYKTIGPEKLRTFHRDHYAPAHGRIMVAGKEAAGLMKLLETNFGSWKSEGKKAESGNSVFNPPEEKKHHIPKKGALQSAIRIGRVLFNRLHPDYLDMQVVNTLLGGYFGSRLMANIREDKGYTYGIGSAVSSMLHSGTFVISTEVGADVCQDALKEIYREIQRLREEKVGEEELDTVKNYMMGSYLSSWDGPFQTADRIRTLRQFGLGKEHFDGLLRSIRDITPEKIMELSRRYLQESELREVVAG